MGSYPGAFPVSGCCRKDVFWVHNLKLSLGRMRAVSSRGTSINGTPSSSQATVLKDFPSGLQIRPRRFDSGFGLHIRKPRRSRSTGFFYACEKEVMCSAFFAGVPHVGLNESLQLRRFSTMDSQLFSRNSGCAAPRPHRVWAVALTAFSLMLHKA